MSQSSQSPSSTSDPTYANSSILNAEAAPFNPYSPRRSVLCPSAPIFVTAVAPMATSQSPIEPSANSVNVQPFEGFLNSNDSFFYGGCDLAIGTVDFGANNESLDFSNFGPRMTQPSDIPKNDDDFVTRPPEYINNDLQWSQPEVFQWIGEPCVLGEPGILPSIEVSFALSPVEDVASLDQNPYNHQSQHFHSIVESPLGRIRQSDAGLGDDIDGAYETDDEYVPPMDASAEDHVDNAAPYPTPEWDWNGCESANDDDIGPAHSTNAATNRSNKSDSTKPCRNPRTARDKSPVIDASIKKPTKARPLAEKFKQANIVIAEQKTKASLAQRLGQQVRIIRTNGRVSIEGVYWKAPKNDPTIPATDAAKKRCVRKIVAALINNQDCKEVPTSQTFLNRWADGADYFTMEEFEHAAWEIVDTMVDIHMNGWTKKILDPNLRECVQKTMLCTFKERLNGVVELLKSSKTTCNDLMKGERFHTVIGNPFELQTRTASNKTSNSNKGKLLKKRKLEAAEMEESEARVTSRPMKRTRKART